MHIPPRKSFPFLLVATLSSIALLFTACQAPLFPPLPEATADSQSASEGVVSAASSEDQVSPDSRSAISAADESTDAGADVKIESVDAPQDRPTATILVSSLRLRSGPGIEYDVLDAALAGEAFSITGQAFDCSWLNGSHPILGTVWFSGAAQYTALNVGCDQVPPAEVPARPAQPTAAQLEVEAENVPTQPLQPQPRAVAPAAVESGPSAQKQTSAQGCYLFQGYAGPALTIEISAIDRDWSTTVNFSGDSSQRYCLTPGPYTVTIVSPAIWKGMGTSFDVEPGIHNLSVTDLLR